MSAKHTPGPWKAVDDGHGYRIEGEGNPSGTVAELLTRRSVTGLADARLIAAAPETTAMLRRFVIAGEEAGWDIGDNAELLQSGRDMLAKAEGRES